MEQRIVSCFHWWNRIWRQSLSSHKTLLQITLAGGPLCGLPDRGPQTTLNPLTLSDSASERDRSMRWNGWKVGKCAFLTTVLDRRPIFVELMNGNCLWRGINKICDPLWVGPLNGPLLIAGLWETQIHSASSCAFSCKSHSPSFFGHVLLDIGNITEATGRVLEYWMAKARVGFKGQLFPEQETESLLLAKFGHTMAPAMRQAAKNIKKSETSETSIISRNGISEQPPINHWVLNFQRCFCRGRFHMHLSVCNLEPKK